MKKLVPFILISLLAFTAHAQEINSDKKIEFIQFLNKYFSNSSNSNTDIRSFHIVENTLIIFHTVINENNTTSSSDTTLISLDQVEKLSLEKGKAKNGSIGLGLKFIASKNQQLLKNIPVTQNGKINPDQLASTSGTIVQKMAGQSAGVYVGNDNSPGGSPKVRIRGITSINSNNNPLYIVDDVPISNINTINPDDIASVEVLKDASSTAMYGVRGANGVVIIKTKRGEDTDAVSDEIYNRKEQSYVLWAFGEKAAELKNSKEGKKINGLLKSIRD